jgi:hypothetical protein
MSTRILDLTVNRESLLYIVTVGTVRPEQVCCCSNSLTKRCALQAQGHMYFTNVAISHTGEHTLTNVGDSKSLWMKLYVTLAKRISVKCTTQTHAYMRAHIHMWSRVVSQSVSNIAKQSYFET